MSEWLANRWVERHQTSRQEASDLLAIVDQDLKDCAIVQLSADRRLGIAYNAALQCSLLALAAAGYRPVRDRHHERAFESLRHTLQIDGKIVQRLQRFRAKRNVGSYERPGASSDAEVVEMIALATSLRADVVAWLRSNHPTLL